eukprot:scaffold12778_cov54-Prasinocladus_malaysianus.AAC.1
MRVDSNERPEDVAVPPDPHVLVPTQRQGGRYHKCVQENSQVELVVLGTFGLPLWIYGLGQLHVENQGISNRATLRPATCRSSLILGAGHVMHR